MKHYRPKTVIRHNLRANGENRKAVILNRNNIQADFY